MDDVDPENLKNLESVATEYMSTIPEEMTRVSNDLKDGRGSDMPGIGR